MTLDIAELTRWAQEITSASCRRPAEEVIRRDSGVQDEIIRLLRQDIGRDFCRRYDVELGDIVIDRYYDCVILSLSVYISERNPRLQYSRRGRELALRLPFSRNLWEDRRIDRVNLAIDYLRSEIYNHIRELGLIPEYEENFGRRYDGYGFANWLRSGEWVESEYGRNQAEEDALLQGFRAYTEVVFAPHENRHEHEEANRKAEKLLLNCMTRSQKSDYKKHGYFFVRGSITGDRYKITPAGQMNIYKVHKTTGEHLSRHCVVFSGDAGFLPMADHLLAQKLLIESNEEHFLEIQIEWRI